VNVQQTLGWVTLGLIMLGATPGLAAEAPQNTPRPPGRLVDIGGYRLHLTSQGRGRPTVVLIAGGGDYSFTWSLVQPAAARFTRVCAYDRAGDAWSDLGPVPRTMRQEAHELRLLLQRAGVRPPYVLVGHSIGGLMARVFAERYGREVAGLVLVDPTNTDTTLMYQGRLVHIREQATERPIPSPQTMTSSPPRAPSARERQEAEEMHRFFGPPKIQSPHDRLPVSAQRLELWARAHRKLTAASPDYFAEELNALYRRTRQPFPHGRLPIIVLVAGQAPRPPGVGAEQWAAMQRSRREEHAHLARLSRRTRFVVAARSGHKIHLEDPALVVRAIREMVAAVRTRRAPRANRVRVRPTRATGR
jgi:pimeloyl-ACP methyl ester carboxylesterase